jgi:hypothetical protein
MTDTTYTGRQPGGDTSGLRCWAHAAPPATTTTSAIRNRRT